MKTSRQRVGLMAAAALLAGCGSSLHAQPGAVRVEKKGRGFQLMRNGQPYFIKGAGGDGSKKLLRDMGGNSFRTWGADKLAAQLDEAQTLGLSVTAGIWLGHKEHGFNYHDAAQVAAQLESARQTIARYKDHPALLMWAIGNEMEMGQENDPAVWQAIEDIAAAAKKIDPNHPTMTVVAEVGGGKVANINKFCPSIDILGINSYAGAPSIAQRYQAAGGVKPYVITEFGPPGTWEMGKNAWGVAVEPSSTAKADFYRKAYEQAIANQPLSLGSYAFTWGNKQEATATWFGLLLPDGSRLGAVDALAELWSGKAPANRVPAIKNFKLAGAEKVAPGATVRAVLEAADPDNDALKVDWVLQFDPASYNTGGATEATPPSYPDAIVKAGAKSAEIKMPTAGGGYRLFAFLHDNHDGAAVANLPILVEGGPRATIPIAKTNLPLAIYDEAGGNAAYAPAGYMGNAAAIKMDEGWTQNPHSGKTCLKVDYTASDNWGGVVWQSPANDWGDAPGGRDLSGATKLTFWARGAKGGEIVNFSFGLIGKEKPYFDTDKNQIEKVRLTDDWQPYTIYVKGQNLTRIKTAFVWTIAATGQPITFYLDDIRYE